MTRKNNAFTVTEDLTGLFAKGAGHAQVKPQATPQAKEAKPQAMTIDAALATVTRYMETTGYRPRTISDYNMHVTHFARITGTTHLAELEASHIYDWLASMDVSNQTKLTRLKCLKAFLGRCFDNGWLASKFWRAVTVRVDSPVKQGAAMKDIETLLRLLDLSDFIQLRDAAALLLMAQTGLRVSTVARLEAPHIDLDERLLKIDGGIIKNHQRLFLPLSDDLTRLLGVLMRQNDAIRKHYGIRNDYLFITRRGGCIVTSPTNNNIQKRLNKYARQYGLKNINPQALRRGFAKNLLDKGAHIALISKALGHADIEVTTRYLYMDKEDVAENLRDYL
ncbi:tyrosine-type recombinase/integrase [Indiicoccus explosivorum]|uniref:tyrosine-type recombinase/integrase n=1 Tax=Indiicoccus explosivorum TaxID=1917864 RepID=UPI000B4358D9|nr:site-specific integrase [Indiicoccus explosivorum]